MVAEHEIFKRGSISSFIHPTVCRIAAALVVLYATTTTFGTVSLSELHYVQVNLQPAAPASNHPATVSPPVEQPPQTNVEVKHTTPPSSNDTLSAASTSTNATEPSIRSNSEFLPSLHGFAFRNSFSVRSLTNNLGPVAKLSMIDAQSTYGKCGGMSAAAADYFYARQRVPTRKEVPGDGTPLFNYITGRQIDSLGAGFDQVGKFLTVMQLPDYFADAPEVTRTVEHVTAPEARYLRSKLLRGEVVPVGLVYVAAKIDANGKPVRATSKRGLPWDNHQVLAYKMQDREIENATVVDIGIYDPNYPGNDNVILRLRFFDADKPLKGDNPSQSATRVSTTMIIGKDVAADGSMKKASTRHVRSIFVMPYARAIPPTDAQ